MTTQAKPKTPRTRTKKAIPPDSTANPTKEPTAPAGTVYGYARVSTQEQGEKYGLDVQKDELTKAGATVIFSEMISGAIKDRPQLAVLLETVKRGDTIIVLKFDRLARNTLHLLEIVESLNAKGVNFKSLSESIDTTTPIGKMFLTIIAGFAELERATIKERTQRGINAYIKEHGTWGRKGIKQSQLDHAKELLLSGMSNAEVSKKTGLKRSTLYHHFPAELVKSWQEMPQAHEPTPTPAPAPKRKGKPQPQALPLYDGDNGGLDNDWRENGLNDEQLSKIKFYSGDFGDMNSDKFLPLVEKGKSYLEILTEITPRLRNPKTATTYKGIDEILAK